MQAQASQWQARTTQVAQAQTAQAELFAREERRMRLAIEDLIIDHPYFGNLAAQLKLSNKNPIKTVMATDGTYLYYTPQRTAQSLTTQSEVMWIVAHEVLHCALCHMYRTDGRDMPTWNIATDHANNWLLVEEFGPKCEAFLRRLGAMLDPRFRGKSAEVIYSILKAEQAEQQQQQNTDTDESENSNETDTDDSNGSGTADSSTEDASDDASDDAQSEDSESDASNESTDSDDTSTDDTSNATEYDDGTGEASLNDVIPAHVSESGESQTDTNADSSHTSENGDLDSDRPMTELDWQVACEQAAMVSRKAGVMPGNVDTAVKASRKGVADWRAILRDFIENARTDDYSWQRPSRRFLAGADLYLPGINSDHTQPGIVCIDTSGSTYPLLEPFATELTNLVNELKPRNVHVIYADDGVQKVESFDTYNGEEVTFNMPGGGGTAFGPTFRHINADEDNLYSDAAWIVYLTDLDGSDNDTIALLEPNIPTLWIVPEYAEQDAPFGQTVRLAL